MWMKDLSQSRCKEMRKQRENVRTKDMTSECGGEESSGWDGKTIHWDRDSGGRSQEQWGHIYSHRCCVGWVGGLHGPYTCQCPGGCWMQTGVSGQKFRLEIQIKNQQTIDGNDPSDSRWDAEIVQGEKEMRKNERGTLGTSTFGRSFGEWGPYQWNWKELVQRVKEPETRKKTTSPVLQRGCSKWGLPRAPGTWPQGTQLWPQGEQLQMRQ